VSDTKDANQVAEPANTSQQRQRRGKNQAGARSGQQPTREERKTQRQNKVGASAAAKTKGTDDGMSGSEEKTDQGRENEPKEGATPQQKRKRVNKPRQTKQNQVNQTNQSTPSKSADGGDQSVNQGFDQASALAGSGVPLSAQNSVDADDAPIDGKKSQTKETSAGEARQGRKRNV